MHRRIPEVHKTCEGGSNCAHIISDLSSPQASPNYEEWKAEGIKLASKLQTLYEDKVNVHWNESPSEARYFITIGVNMEGDVIRLLDFAKAQGII